MSIQVSDPFGAASDPELPTARLALDTEQVGHEFKRGLPRLATEQGQVLVKSIRVIRHKPGKRCVIEYDVRVERPDAPRKKTTLIGKLRARRFGHEGYRLQDAIWSAGFQKTSADEISVPQPVGFIPKLQMWLQMKVPGTLATELLTQPEGIALARRIAEAIHKLHRANVPSDRKHTMDDELRILREHLPFVAEGRTNLAKRIDRVLESCDHLGARVPQPKVCGIHRDFYPAQVIVHRERLFLLDFDLYCQGDPALDVGNFLGHVTEQSLRCFGDPSALADREKALKDRFVELTSESARFAVDAYTTLTLVRHIYLSTQFAERHPFTEALVKLCEQRLDQQL